MPAATVSIAFVRSAVLALGDADRAEALSEAGIDPARLRERRSRVPAAAFARLWLAVARRLDDEFFGLDRRRMKVGSFAMLCRALATQRSVGAAMRLALRGFTLFLDDIEPMLRVAGGVATVAVANRIAPAWAARDPLAQADARRFADETLLVMLYGLLCWLSGRRVALSRLRLAHPLPAHADEYQRMFSPVIEFDAACSAIEFDAAVLAAQPAVDEQSLKTFLRDAPQSVFLKQVAGAGVGERVRRLCRKALGRGETPPTLVRLATALKMSPATLRRRLAAEGASWQALKDAERRSLALAQLDDGRTTVAALAERLGFQDPSTFYRAFRKWTGQAPGAWRRR